MRNIIVAVMLFSLNGICVNARDGFYRDAREFPASGDSVCGGFGRHVCDTAGVIGTAAGRRLQQKLLALETTAPKHSCGQRSTGFQFGVVTTKSIGDSGSKASASTVQRFTEEVFNSWGVGHKECNDGLLLVMSIDDRKNYLKTGRYTRSVLTDNHAVDILADVRPLLRAKEYHEALLRVADRVIEEALIPGRPPTFYWIDSWLLGLPHFFTTNPVMSFFLLAVVGAVLWQIRIESKRQERRDSFETKLRRLQAARDKLAKRGDCREAPCPICLEELPRPLDFSKGRRDQGCELLQCGHVFHQECIARWLRQTPRCPVCRLDRPELSDPKPDDPQGDPKDGAASSGSGRNRAAEPDNLFWFVARENLARDYNDIPAVSRVRRGWDDFRGFDASEDWFGTYTESLHEIQREEEAMRAASRTSSGGSDCGDSGGGDWGGGSCDGGGGGGGDW